MRTGNNTPYVKSYNTDGTLSNPITAANPYVSTDSTRRQRRFYIQNSSSSKKNTPNKRQQIVFLDTVKVGTKIIVLSSRNKIIYHERKG